MEQQHSEEMPDIYTRDELEDLGYNDLFPIAKELGATFVFGVRPSKEGLIADILTRQAAPAAAGPQERKPGPSAPQAGDDPQADADVALAQKVGVGGQPPDIGERILAMEAEFIEKAEAFAPEFASRRDAHGFDPASVGGQQLRDWQTGDVPGAAVYSFETVTPVRISTTMLINVGIHKRAQGIQNLEIHEVPGALLCTWDNPDPRKRGLRESCRVPMAQVKTWRRVADVEGQ